MSNVTGFTVPTDGTDKLRKLLAQGERESALYLELYAMVARQDFAKLKAYTKAGFTEGQALELLKAEKVRVSL